MLPGFTHANSGTSYYALKGDISGAIATWSTFPAISTINASGYSITNASSLQIDDQVLTALSGELLLNGVPIATISGISNVSDWALYPAIANVNISNFAIQNASGITTTTLSAGSVNVNGLPVVTTPSTTDINLSGNNITNAASVQIGTRTLTTTAGTAAAPYLLLNGSNVLSNWSSFAAGTAVSMGLNDINNAKDIYASGTINAGAMNTTSSITISAQVLTTTPSALFLNGVQVASTSNDVAQWANYAAVANVNLSGFNIQNVSSLNVLDVITPTITMCSSVTPTSSVAVTANDTQLLVNGQPVYTGALPPSDTSNWANYPAVANVNMSGKAIFAGTDALTTNDLSMYGLNINLNAGGAGSCNINLKGNVKASTNIDIANGHIVQCNVAGSGTQNKFAAATTFGDSANLGYAEVLGSARVAGFSSFYVEGGVTFDGGTLHGFKCTTAGAGIFGLARFELTPVLTYIASAGPITTASVTYNLMTALLNCRVAAGTFVTLEHGVLGGFDGIYLQNTLNQGSNTRVIMTAGGTIYNCGNMQTSNLFTTNPVQFWSNVYNPSGGAVPAPPSEGGNTITPIVYTDPNRKNTLQGNFTRWFPAYGAYTTSGGPQSYYAAATFSNTTLIGDYSSSEFSPGGVGAYTPTWFGNDSVHIGRQTISGTAGGSTMGDQAVAIGRIDGWIGNGTSNNILIGTHLNGVTGQGGDCIAIGTDSGMTGQSNYAIAIGSNAGQLYQDYDAIAIGNGAAFNAQSSNAIAIGNDAGADSQGADGIAIGRASGSSLQGIGAIAMGIQAGQTNQGPATVALGYRAGLSDQQSFATAIGYNAGVTTQGNNAVAIGREAGNADQGVAAIAMGILAGNITQGAESVAIGEGAGRLQQGSQSVAIGSAAGDTSQGVEAVAIGPDAGSNTQGAGAVAVGNAAGQNSQQVFAVAIGTLAGNATQGSNSVAIGFNAGSNTQGSNNVAIGNAAGQSNQLTGSVAIGNAAGQFSQQGLCVAIGSAAGTSNQQTNCVAVGNGAGNLNQGTTSVAVGVSAGSTTQGSNAVAVGQLAGTTGQGSSAVAVGALAGNNTQGSNCVAIGALTGQSNQGIEAVAIGANAGQTSQQQRGTAVGFYAGSVNQGYAATGLGVGAGYSGQGSNSVAVGYNSGNVDLGTNSIAIGYSASVNGGSFSNTIVLNATGATLNPAQASSTYIAPLRSLPNSNAYQSHLAFYNDTTKEVLYEPSAYSLQVIASSGTPIVLLPPARGKTFILTGTTTQGFTTTALGANDVGWFCIVHNGNATNGGDINLTGMSGTAIIHEQKPTQNGGSVYLYWNGTTLTGY